MAFDAMHLHEMHLHEMHCVCVVMHLHEMHVYDCMCVIMHLQHIQSIFVGNYKYTLCEVHYNTKYISCKCIACHMCYETKNACNAFTISLRVSFWLPAKN